jgi:predicted NBD/HSP70 family sugar kinase
MASGRRILAFDVGGTNIRGALYDGDPGRLLASRRRPTWNFLDRPGSDAERLLRGNLDEMRAIARSLTDGVPPDAAVVGWPGPIAPDGTVLRSPTIFGASLDRALDIGAELERLWPGTPTAVLNDLTCAGYAYVGEGHRDFCIVTVGSGIANKVFVGGRPLLGPSGRGGEIGHLVARLPPGCPPGVAGPDIHLGDVGSGRGTLRLGHRLARAKPELFARSVLARDGMAFGNEALVAAFHAEDAFALEVVALSAAALGYALASVHVSVGTERFFVTGGFGTALGERYRRLLAEHARAVAWDLGEDWDAMVEIGDDVDGLTGAAVYAMRELLARAPERAA